MIYEERTGAGLPAAQATKSVQTERKGASRIPLHLIELLITTNRGVDTK